MSEIPRGAIRFNTDSNKPELWDGSQWAEFQLSTPNLGRGVDTEPGARGVIAGNNTPSYVGDIDYINISSTGDSVFFGDLIGNRGNGVGAFSSNTRGVFFGGNDSITSSNVMDFVTISSTGNALNFGDLRDKSEGVKGLSNQTRGIEFGGFDRPASSVRNNVIGYVTISSTGNSQDFGDLAVAVANFGNGAANIASPTRGIFGGYYNPSPGAYVNIINYLTINTLGDSVDFGDLTAPRGTAGGCSNSIRGLFMNGSAPAGVNTIEYVTIATTGNAVNFGDSSFATSNGYSGALASSIRGVVMGYTGSPAPAASFSYVNIMTEGNGVDFGDHRNAKTGDGGFTSNAHGGL